MYARRRSSSRGGIFSVPRGSSLSLRPHASRGPSDQPHIRERDRSRGSAKMRLLTHNMLTCNIKGVTNGFPLRIEATNWVEKPVDLNADFLCSIFPKIDWAAFVSAARALGYDALPEAADATMLNSEDFLKKFHHALLEIHVEEGELVCPESGRRFPINKGIPNMLLHEDEV